MAGVCPEVEGEDFPGWYTIGMLAGFEATGGVLEAFQHGMRLHDNGNNEVWE